jgi:hypothetical protein
VEAVAEIVQTDTLPNGAACWRTCLPEDAPAAPSSRDWTLDGM